MVWVTRSGCVEEVDPSWVGRFRSPSLSPDGTRLALEMDTPDERQVFIKQLDRGPFSRLTFEGRSLLPTWAPDGQSVLFRSEQNREADELFQRRADGSVPSELVPSLGGVVKKARVSSDG